VGARTVSPLPVVKKNFPLLEPATRNADASSVIEVSLLRP
jgi:hypothetical protein